VTLRVALSIVSFGLLLPAGPVAAQQADVPPRFTSAVDVVSVTAVVRDRRGRLVRDLERRDFTIIEGGEPRPILDVRLETDGPVRLALLIDVSGSMRMASRVVDARLAAYQLFSALGPGDEAAIYVFDTQLERVTDFTSEVERLEAGLDQVVQPFGQTSLYDAVAQTAQAIAGEHRGPGGSPQGSLEAPSRLAVVVLTDGIDTSSRLSPVEVSGIASGIDVPVYVLAVMSSVDDPRHSADGRAAQAVSELGNLSRWTGGELLTASLPAHANIAARRIVDELRHQYVVAFEASTEPGWRPVEVRARNRGHVVRTRAGYVAGGVGLPVGTVERDGGSERERRRTR
jgi:VWFA-related protein